jgi:glycosyltransferase involved in cell wall biosynthesis
VSVVTPVYNGGRFLAECIESVLAQTYTDFEYVICDNHSTDDTAAIASRYAERDARIRVVSPPTFLPQIRNWNFAASQITPASRYLKFVHADDTLAPACLERMVELAESSPGIGIVGSLRRVGDGEIDLDGLPPVPQVVPGRWLLKHQLTGGRYTTGPPTATLLRRSALGPLEDLYDTSYVHADDPLAYKVLLDSDFGYVPEVLTFTRLHDASTTAWCERIGTWTPEHLRMALEYGPAVLDERELKRVVRRREAQYGVILTKAILSTKLVRDREARRYHRAALTILARAGRERGLPLRRVLRLYRSVLRAVGPLRGAETPTPVVRS